MKTQLPLCLNARIRIMEIKARGPQQANRIALAHSHLTHALFQRSSSGLLWGLRSQ